jgi:hypothetical protein
LYWSTNSVYIKYAKLKLKVSQWCHVIIVKHKQICYKQLRWIFTIYWHKKLHTPSSKLKVNENVCTATLLFHILLKRFLNICWIFIKELLSHTIWEPSFICHYHRSNPTRLSIYYAVVNECARSTVWDQSVASDDKMPLPNFMKISELVQSWKKKHICTHTDRQTDLISIFVFFQERK